MSATTGAAYSSIYNLANLTAPASGVTHAAKFIITITGGGTAQLNMNSQMEFLGAFLGQAMTVDNTANAVSVTVQELTYGWSRSIPGGVSQTFQFPAVQNQIFTFTTTASATITLSVYDWPAFPDSASLNTTNAQGTPVYVVNEPTVLQGTSPWVVGGTVAISGQPVQIITSQGTATAGSAHAIATGGTAVTIFAAGAIVHEGLIINPTSATESMFVDFVNNAGTIAPGPNGTTMEIVAGNSCAVPPLATAVTGNAVTTGHTFTSVKW
jgi:hypothetical protein